MKKDILIGLDAGTSVIKAVAFDLTGRQLGVAGVGNRYRTSPDGAAVQGMAQTWQLAAQMLYQLSETIPDLASRALAMGVTAQGDGTWLIDAGGAAVDNAMLWLDSRAVEEARAITGSDRHDTIYRATATGVNLCQMRAQLPWLRRTAPGTVAKAAHALHCKEWLYCCLTGEAVADVSEAVLNFGDIRTRAYSDDVIAALGLDDLRHLLPPIVDGSRTAHKLTQRAAAETGLPAGLPVSLGYMDIVTSGIATGLCDAAVRPGLSILGSTGVHTRHAATVDDIVLNPDRTGYTVALADGAFGQVQTNMAAAINIDWIAGIAGDVLKSAGHPTDQSDILGGFDALVASARPGAAAYHPYIAPTGERGPFSDAEARASFTGLDRTVGWPEMVRGVYEGLAMAARDCYAAMGAIPDEIRVAGGAARSAQLVRILAATLDRPVRAVAQEETGAAGAAMIAAVQSGVFGSLEEASTVWVTPLLCDAVPPDPDLTRLYDGLFPAFRDGRHTMQPLWHSQARTRKDIS
ncbi:FGGY-family carbohydrate kinase [Antarctobacter sp.]|uniref:FGGY-family carbohydrate kinase n=1 Tax=Antarctobacter sp. TaxID=1872577 RepID=UPI002B26C281|nr:FGGY-family carbohydrate kinase [Antarctobacter sp.]